MDKSEFVSFKKVLVFGAESTGKTTFKNQIKKDKFIEEKPSKDSNYFF